MNLRALKRLLFLSLVLKITTTQDIDDSVVADNVPSEEVEAAADETLFDDDTEEWKPDVDEENDVFVLTESNFQNVVEFYSPILVEFYAPWCGHCKNLAPEYEKAAAALKAIDPPLRIAKVDATVEESIAKMYEVSGYPTLKFFTRKNREVIDYDGERNAAGIEQWVLEHSDPDWAPPPDEAVVLTEANFTKFINKYDLSLVEFYAPWCGHCKKMAPEYSRAAKILKDLDEPIMLAKVDATEEPNLATKHGATGYPSLKMFRKGKSYEYKGPRDEHGIVNYMMSQQRPASLVVYTDKELRDSLSKTDVTIVGVFNNEYTNMIDTYMEAANQYREDYNFVHGWSKPLKDRFNVRDENMLIAVMPEQFYSPHEPLEHKFSILKNTAADALTLFIDKHNVPLVGEVTSSSLENRYKSKKPLVVVFYSVDWSFDYRDATEFWRRKIVEIAKDYRKLTFAVADEMGHEKLFKGFGFEDSGEELNIGIVDAKDRKFPMEPMDSFDSDEVRQFLDDFQKGKLTSYIRSLPVPKKQGAVKTVVGKNFEKIVMDPKKDVLLEFYAPWCGHCKKFEPIYKDLAKKYKEEKNMVIAKMDGTANDWPPYLDVKGFPTIYFIPKDNKEQPELFNGDRNLDALVEFLEEKSSVLRASRGVGEDEPQTKDEL